MHDFPMLEIGGLNIDISTFLTITVTFVIVLLLALLSVRNLSVNNPSKLQNFLEWVVDFVHNLVASTMPLKKAKMFVSLGMTLIMFIFVGNLLGLPFAVVTEHEKPLELFGHTVVSEETIQKAHDKGHHAAEVVWWKSPTADINVTAALAVLVFLTVHILGLKLNTKHYLQHYFKPYWFFFPLNIIETLAKPLTLSLRLYANIFAGEVLIATITMAGWYGIPLMVAWQGFSVFVGAIQAFLFTILTMVYISSATVHEEHH